ncbi:kinase-like protein [Venturia nashicola]|nr:kinase-like protein [Venturia nashicola]
MDVIDTQLTQCTGRKPVYREASTQLRGKENLMRVINSRSNSRNRYEYATILLSYDDTDGKNQNGVGQQDPLQWPQLLPTINNTFARRVLTLTACKLLRRFRPRRGIVLFLSKRICVKSSSRTHPFEASTMRFVEDNTSIPVPKVYCSFVHNGRTYIVMERIQGEMLARVWKSRSTESQTKILEQLKKFTQELRSLAQLDTVGVTNVDGGLLYDIRLGSQRFGPFQTVQEFHSFLRGGRARALGFDPEIDQMMERQDGPWPPPIFTHGDLSSLNILVRGDEVVGIVDWETAGWYPSYWEYATACQVNIHQDIIKVSVIVHRRLALTQNMLWYREEMTSTTFAIRYLRLQRWAGLAFTCIAATRIRSKFYDYI